MSGFPSVLRGAQPIPVSDRLAREADLLAASSGRYAVAAFTKSDGTTGTSTNGPSGLISGAGYLLGNPLTFVPCRDFYITSITISSNKNATISVAINNASLSGGGTQPTPTLPVSVGPGSGMTLPINQFISGSQNGSITLYVREVLDTDLTNCVFNVAVSGFDLWGDTNFDASGTILWVGDSISRQSTGSPAKGTSFVNSARKYYIETAGQNVRLLVKAYSGATSATIEDMRQNGKLDVANDGVGLVVYALGMNDSGSAVSSSAFMANVNAFIAWSLKRYPNAKLLLLGPSPAESNSREALLSQYRTAQAARVAALANPNIAFADLGTAFTRTDTSFYNSGDSAGDHIHPTTVAAQTALGNIVTTALAANFPRLIL